MSDVSDILAGYAIPANLAEFTEYLKWSYFHQLLQASKVAYRLEKRDTWNDAYAAAQTRYENL